MKPLFILQLLFIYLPSDGRTFRCDYDYFKDINGYIKYQEIPANWREARLRCHLEGSKLASPLNPGLRYAMLRYSNTSVCGVFTGLHSTFSRGDYFSVEGVPLARVPHTWTEGEPNNDKDKEGCIVMLSDGTFADVNCAETFPYLCYKKAAPNMFMSECGTSDTAYKLDRRTGSCYKFHQFPRTWSRAYMTCAAEGGYLAVINSDTEAKVLSELYTKMGVPIPYAGEYWTLVAHVGVHDWNEHGEWLTIHGDTIKDAGYDKFSPGEPNNSSSEFCGAIYRSGLFDDFWCERRAQFICEKDPEFLTCDHEQ
ncbi:secretory phospholipase A2 receptor-like [Hyposmocoma kahamanoa]|uniref:secretory phospholipase A2 receptor-like n=1 Tax=Hyposmocoma kahamanoa TaxID=1477025 RepID=UPI000E6DA1BA|nr:secretory phospholipase A2 receptor-like [Hyposmocoma kahamanoa]